MRRGRPPSVPRNLQLTPCASCGKQKPESEFHVRAGREIVTRPACNRCTVRAIDKSLREQPKRRVRAVRTPGLTAAEYQRVWRKKNQQRVRDRQRGYGARRRAMLRAGATGAETRAWLAEQERICRWCKALCAEGFHIDHIMPLSRGGLHELGNLCISCVSCNLRKHARHPEEFALIILAEA